MPLPANLYFVYNSDNSTQCTQDVVGRKEIIELAHDGVNIILGNLIYFFYASYQVFFKHLFL